MGGEWVVVVGADPTSQRQLEICNAERPPLLHAAIRCDAPENAGAAACMHVPRLPAFCHTESNVCVYGLRDTRDALERIPADAARVVPHGSAGSEK